MSEASRKYLSLVCTVCSVPYTQQARLYKVAVWKDRCSKHRKADAPKCSTCGVVVTAGYAKCKKCNGLEKTLPKKLCKDCGITIDRKAVSRCLPCHNKQQDKGLSRERTKFQNSSAWKTVRTECFTRDDYTCQICNVRGGCLECHHVKRYTDNTAERLSLDNLLTLCYGCHKYVHRPIKELIAT